MLLIHMKEQIYQIYTGNKFFIVIAKNTSIYRISNTIRIEFVCITN